MSKELQLGTASQSPIAEALEASHKNVGDMLRTNHSIFYLLKALVLAVCAVADSINTLTAKLPNREK
jgi:hypothetical protein